MKSSTKSVVGLVAGAVLLVMASSATTAVATRLITGDDIADRSLTGADIQRGSVNANRIKPGTVALHHLDRDSVRAGHVHSSSEPVVIGAPSGRDSARAVTLMNGAKTTVASVGGLDVGTYLVIATGEVDLALLNANNVWYQNTGTCSIGVGNTLTATQKVVSNSQGLWTQVVRIAMTKLVTLTAPGGLGVICTQSVPSSIGVTFSGALGTAMIDLVAVPVTSWSGG